MSHLVDEILETGRAEVKAFLAENEGHIREILSWQNGESLLRSVFEAYRIGNTFGAQTEFYKALDPRQRKEFRSKTIEELKNAVNKRLRAASILASALQHLSKAGNTILGLWLDLALRKATEAVSPPQPPVQ